MHCCEFHFVYTPSLWPSIICHRKGDSCMPYYYLKYNLAACWNAI